MKINESVFTRCFFSVALVLLLTACAIRNTESTDSFLAADSTSVTGVGHIGEMVGIPEFYVNGRWGGNASGWGGGGGSVCCVKIPKATADQPAMVKVEWETCDISHIKFVNHRAVDPDSRCISTRHEATVPVHFADPKLGNLYVHFLPENKIEVWSVKTYMPYSPDYPGPAYPRGDPGPDYASPLDDKRLIKKVQP